MGAQRVGGNRHSRDFREPVFFRLRFILATEPLLGLVLVVAIVAIVALGSRYLLPPVASLLGGAGTLISQPGVSTLIGALVGAGVSLGVSITLQREQYKAKSLLDRKSEIYEPLLRSIIAFLRQLELQPFPWRIAHLAGVPNFSLLPQAGFLEWSEVVTSGNVIHVPAWLRNAFEATISNIDEYNARVASCSSEVQTVLAHELMKRGLIESASGFSEIGLILSANYEARVVTPFAQTKYPDGKPDPHDEIVSLLPSLFHEYGQREDVEAIRDLYRTEILARATWLKAALEHVIRFIELSYGSRDSHV